MPTSVGILTFISMINTTFERLEKAGNFFICHPSVIVFGCKVSLISTSDMSGMISLNGNLKSCITLITLLFAEKYSNLNKFRKFQLGEGVYAILKKVGLYLQNDSYHTSNSPYTITLGWSDMQICR